MRRARVRTRYTKSCYGMAPLYHNSMKTSWRRDGRSVELEAVLSLTNHHVHLIVQVFSCQPNQTFGPQSILPKTTYTHCGCSKQPRRPDCYATPPLYQSRLPSSTPHCPGTTDDKRQSRRCSPRCGRQLVQMWHAG